VSVCFATALPLLYCFTAALLLYCITTARAALDSACDLWLRVQGKNKMLKKMLKMLESCRDASNLQD
jgi:hypothetical protein